SVPSSLPEVSHIPGGSARRINVVEPRATIRPRNEVVGEPICDLGTVNTDAPQQMHYTPEIVRTAPGRIINFNRKSHWACRHFHLYVPRDDVSKHGRGKPVRIRCGEKDTKPHIGICLGKVECDCRAGNACGRREKWMSMMVRVTQ